MTTTSTGGGHGDGGRTDASAFMIDPYRLDRQWYLQLHWRRWFHPHLMGYQRSLRKTDVLMSAMFKAACGQAIPIARLVEAVGMPDWLEGTLRNGISLYALHTRVDIDMHTHYALFMTVHGLLQRHGGTNLRLQFRVHGDWHRLRDRTGKRSAP